MDAKSEDDSDDPPEPVGEDARDHPNSDARSIAQRRTTYSQKQWTAINPPEMPMRELCDHASFNTFFEGVLKPNVHAYINDILTMFEGRGVLWKRIPMLRIISSETVRPILARLIACKHKLAVTGTGNVFTFNELASLYDAFGSIRLAGEDNAMKEITPEDFDCDDHLIDLFTVVQSHPNRSRDVMGAHGGGSWARLT